MIRKLIKWAVVGDGMSSRIPFNSASLESQSAQLMRDRILQKKSFKITNTILLKHRLQLDVPKVPCQATATYTKVVVIALSSCTSEHGSLSRLIPLAEPSPFNAIASKNHPGMGTAQ